MKHAQVVSSSLPCARLALHCLLLALFGFGLVSPVQGKRPSPRVIRTNSGTIRGIIVQSYNQQLQPVEAFLGVPYAAAPLGPLRFQPPTHPKSWKGVRDVVKFSNVCPQRLPNITDNGEAVKRMPRGRFEHLKRLKEYLGKQSEDCLYLNIYIPARGKLLCYL